MQGAENELNEAQRRAVAHVAGPLLVVAGAGAGKTRVIVERIANLIRNGVAPEEILAVTFTNKAAKEMRERVLSRIANGQLVSPLNARRRGHSGTIPSGAPFVSTFHSLGVYILRSHGRTIGVPQRFGIFDRSDSVRAVRAAMKELGYDSKQYEPRKVLSIISKQKGDAIPLAEYERQAGSEHLARVVADVWDVYEKTLQREKALDFDDLLLKTLELLRENKAVREQYQNAWRYIHIDEYQDTNRVQYRIAEVLALKHTNICVVGDMDQCVASGTLVTMADKTKRPIKKVKAGDMVLSNYGSGDYRAASVLRTHKHTVTSDLIEISFNTGETVTSTPEHVYFAGYHLGKTPQKYFTYLMQKTGVGFRVGVSQMYTSGKRYQTPGFQLRCNHEHADAVWVIAAYDSPQEARILEYTLSLQYTLPTLPFVARKGLSVRGYIHDQRAINAIFETFDTELGAYALLRDYRLSPDYPHHRPQSRNSNRRNISIVLCGDRRGKTPMHRISIIGNDTKGKQALTCAGFSVRHAKVGSKSWRFETCRKSYADILEIAHRIQGIFENATIIQTARLGTNKRKTKEGNSLAFLPASSIQPGMVLFNERSGYSVVEKVTRKPIKKAVVHDIDVQYTHNFIANGIITHNSIYSWRGADMKNMLSFERQYPDATVVFLEENYRSTKNILSASNTVIQKNKNRADKTLFTNKEAGEKVTLLVALDEAGEAYTIAGRAKMLIGAGVEPRNIAVLYRTNFQSRILEEAFLSEQVPYQVLGTRFFERKEVKDVLAYCRLALLGERSGDLARVLNVPTRGIGKVTLLKILEGKEGELTGRMKERVSDFRKLCADMHGAVLTKKPSDAVSFILKATGLEAALKKEGEDGEERLLNIKELAVLARRYDTLPPEEGMAKLLEDAALATDQDEMDEEKNAVRLSTVHASKGLEFDVVFIAGLEEGLFPHTRTDERNDPEEERRLFYVALTRAREKVFLSYAHTRTIFGASGVNLPSEFIGDIDERLLEEDSPVESAMKTIFLD